MRFLSPVIELTETDAKPRVRVQLLKQGKYMHPQAPGGVLDLTAARIQEIYDNFKAGARGPMLPCDEDHEDKRKRRPKSWLVGMEIVDGKLYGTHEVVDKDLAQALRDKKMRFFSPELKLGWVDPADKKAKDVMFAGAWTNMPFIKDMDPAEMVNLSEIEGEFPDFAILLAEAVAPAGNSGEAGENNNLDEALDPDASDANLPQQCASCKLLQLGTCPFDSIDYKKAAAEDGQCPQYVDIESSSTYPEGSQPKGDSHRSEVRMSEKTLTQAEADALVESRVKEALEAAKKAHEESTAVALAETNRKLESVQAELVNMAEVAAATEDRSKLDKLVAEERITAAQASIALNIFAADRSGGTIELSDESGNKSKKSISVLLSEFLESIEPPTVSLSNASPVRARSTDREDSETDAKAVQLAKELAVGSGKPYTFFYGQAVRQIAAARTGGN